jgi:hypothetical protein
MPLHQTIQYHRLVTLAYTACQPHVSLTLAICRLLCKGLRRCDQYKKRSGHHGDMCERERGDTKGFSEINIAQRNGWLLHSPRDYQTARIDLHHRHPRHSTSCSLLISQGGGI